MGHLSEGRVSDSPYIEMIWRGRAGSEYAPTCPADSRSTSHGKPQTAHHERLGENGNWVGAMDVTLTKVE
jgi:hypothetical protein